MYDSTCLPLFQCRKYKTKVQEMSIKYSAVWRVYRNHSLKGREHKVATDMCIYSIYVTPDVLKGFHRESKRHKKVSCRGSSVNKNTSC